MARGLILETTFWVDLERELRRGVHGPATAFLEAHPRSPLYLTHTITGELASGQSLAERSRWQAFIEPFRVLGSSIEEAWHYGEAYRFLKGNGLMIGANDLWIAATALASGFPVVTRNVDHFRRVPGLEVLEY